MATLAQHEYISDLVVKKTKEFKEVKEMLVASGIVHESAQTIKNAQDLSEITDALTDYQASQFIEILTKAKEPARGRQYATKRINRAIDTLAEIKSIINDWDFS